MRLRTDDGVVVAHLVNDILVKKVRESRHMLRSPKAWSFDKSIILTAQKHGARTIRVEAGDTGKVEVHIVRKGHKDAFYSAHFSIVSDFTRHSKAKNDTLASSEYASMTGWRLEDMFAYMLEQGFEINHIGHTRHSYHGGVWYGKTPKPEGKLDIMWTREL